MRQNLHKFWPATALSLVLFTPCIHAETVPSSTSAQVRSLENRVAALEQRKGPHGMVNPPGRPQLRDGINLFLTADFLFWNAHENGLPLAVRNEGSTTDLSDAKVVNFEFEWDPGFRVGLGYNLSHDGWDLYLNYLHFNTDADRHTHADGGDADFPSQTVGVASFNTKTSGHWFLNLNQIDLTLGREFYVSKWLTLRPNFGLRTDWIHQRLTAHYKGFGYVPSQRAHVHKKNDFWGLGAVAGLDTQWGLGGGWCIYGNSALAILYGFFDNHFEEDSVTTRDFVDLHNSYHTSRVIADLQLGVRWDQMFCDNRYHFSIQAGWEHHVYFGQNQFERFYTNNVDNNLGGVFANQGDLSLQGWTLSARFDF